MKRVRNYGHSYINAKGHRKKIAHEIKGGRCQRV